MKPETHLVLTGLIIHAKNDGTISPEDADEMLLHIIEADPHGHAKKWVFAFIITLLSWVCLAIILTIVLNR